MRRAGCFFVSDRRTLPADVASGHDNNKFASCGGDRAGFLWDVATGKMIRKYHGHQGVCTHHASFVLRVKLLVPHAVFDFVLFFGDCACHSVSMLLRLMKKAQCC